MINLAFISYVRRWNTKTVTRDQNESFAPSPLPKPKWIARVLLVRQLTQQRHTLSIEE